MGRLSAVTRAICGIAALTLAALLPVGAADGATKSVRYRDLTLHAPRDWPVYRLAHHPTTCVRFDRHALYLGRPSARQRCPAHAVGRTGAALVDSSGTAIATGPRGRHVVAAVPGPTRTPDSYRAPSPEDSSSKAAAPVPTGAAYTGRGFDICSTPSSAAMRAWGKSPYRGIGVYLGGVNSACAQPNLTKAWVAAEAGAGWHLIPIYVGLQAPTVSCGCAKISPRRAATEGTAAANDAVSRAGGLGIATGSPIYFDMEAYSRGSSTRTVLRFLAAWTRRLHAVGYLSGVYSSGASGITDLAAKFGSGYLEPDDIWVANWNGRATTKDPYLPSSTWLGHKRIHQYAGGHGERYGGVSLDIDSDAVDADTAGTSAIANELSLIKLRHTSGTVEVRLDALDGGSFKRSFNATSDFSLADAPNGTWQLFGHAHGAPELGFIQVLGTTGTVEVHWDTLQHGTYVRAGDFTSDFSPEQAAAGHFQLFGGAHGVPELGFIGDRATTGDIEVQWDALQGSSYVRTAEASSDFTADEASDGHFQLFGGTHGAAPELGFIEYRHAGANVRVQWDTLRKSGAFRRAGDLSTGFSTRDRRDGLWQLADIGAKAPEVTFVKLLNTAGSIEGSWELRKGTSFRPAGEAASDFGAASAPNGTWQLGPR